MTVFQCLQIKIHYIDQVEKGGGGGGGGMVSLKGNL